MIVPDRNQGHCACHGLQTGIPAILRVTLAIIFKRQDFMGRFVHPIAGFVGRIVNIRPILVVIVTQMQERVIVRLSADLALSDQIVGIEIAMLIVRAGHDREAELLR